jgi:hypothetical protein
MHKRVGERSEARTPRAPFTLADDGARQTSNCWKSLLKTISTASKNNDALGAAIAEPAKRIFRVKQ